VKEKKLTTKSFTWAGIAVLAVLVLGVTLIAGGEDEDTRASQTDGAFVAGMVPHHEGAIKMARIARERARHHEIRELADEVIATQTAEIETLESIHERLFGEPVGAMSHGSMGLDAQMMGMDADMSMLESASGPEFDRAFIDVMIAHHQGAVRMAQIELAEGEDPETRALAEDVIEAQSREIDAMNGWRERWYGEPSPSGGVPAEGETMDARSDGMDGMGSMPGMAH
jgi:uncharacterized protein (DUF305 family)